MSYDKTSAFSGLGLVLNIGTKDSLPVFTEIGEVKSVTGPQLKNETADVTNVQSPGGVKEFISTLTDPGEVSFSVNYVPDDPGQAAVYAAAISKARLPFQLILPPTSEEDGESSPGQWTFDGLVTEYGVEIPLDKEAALNIKIKVSGLPSFEAAA